MSQPQTVEGPEERISIEGAFLCPFCGAPYRKLIPAGTVQVRCEYCGAMILVPPKLREVQRCPNHPDRISVGICEDCGKGFCGDCLTVMMISESSEGTGPKAIRYLCPDCLRKRKRGEAAAPFALLPILALAAWFFLLFKSIVLLIVMIVYSLFAAIALSSSKSAYEGLPTFNMLMKKMSELRRRVEVIKAKMSEEEVERLYSTLKRKDLVTDPYTGRYMYRGDIDNTIEKYMRSGLTRREAVIQLAIEKGIPLRPGLHVPPTIYDAFSELKREIKKEMAKAVRVGSHGEEYERLIDKYSRIYGRSRYALEHKIEEYMMGGLSREEAIRVLAEEEGVT